MCPTRCSSRSAISISMRQESCECSARAKYSRLVTASSGLLISWAIVAASRPAAASFSVLRSASSVRFRPLISMHMPAMRRGSPVLLYSTVPRPAIQSVLPSRRRIRCSISYSDLFWKEAAMVASARARSSGITVVFQASKVPGYAPRANPCMSSTSGDHCTRPLGMSHSQSPTFAAARATKRRRRRSSSCSF